MIILKKSVLLIFCCLTIYAKALWESTEQYSSRIDTGYVSGSEEGAHNKTLTLSTLPKYYANACERMDLRIPGYSDFKNSDINY